MKFLYRLSAFPKSTDGGNKAGVYINADSLNQFEMQEIAKVVGYSETAFVSKSEVSDFKVRFFTPTAEVDLCGHATIATFNLLRDLGLVDNGLYSQETKAGILNIDIRKDFVFMQQPKPIFSEVLSEDEVNKCFTNLELDNKFKPQIVSTGLREIFLPVKNIDTLNKLNPLFEEIISLAKKYNAIGIHAFSLEKSVDAYGRNFAPVVGINEESATGTSNGALAAYLYRYHSQKESYTLRQGYSMNKPSEIIVNLDIIENKIVNIWVGGTALVLKDN